MLPRGFEVLDGIRTLNLEGNSLETLPAGIGKWTSLQTLHLDRNRIRMLPDAFCGISTLKKLTIEKNQLIAIPERMKHMSLIELRIGQNRIERLRDDLFSAELGAHIKVRIHETK